MYQVIMYITIVLNILVIFVEETETVDRLNIGIGFSKRKTLKKEFEVFHGR
jgi:hypothetical protein